MNYWNNGYVTDINYTFGYYPELNPLSSKLPLIRAGFLLPEIKTACELGCGQGLSMSIHAAASSIAWYGTDFNPSQAAFGQELAIIPESGAKFYDQSFTEFCHRSDLPDFDFICLHGIWSWVSEDNRAIIADFIRRKLKVGGLVYVSYNVLPGWSATSPLRHLMTQHSNVMGSPGQGIASRIDGAFSFIEQLFATEPRYSQLIPQALSHFQDIKNHDRHYLAHEYFNRDWQPMYFSEFSERILSAKVNFASSANCLDFVDAINLKNNQIEILSKIEDEIFRQTVRDYCVNQEFRKDYWIKGPRRLSLVEQVESFNHLQFTLITHLSECILKVRGSLGEGKLSEEVYEPILECFSDYKPKTIGTIVESLIAKGITFDQIVEAILLLNGLRYLAPVQNVIEIEKSKISSQRLNHHLLQKARYSNDISYLASPVTGGGIYVTRFQQLFMNSIAAGRKLPSEWALDAWHIIGSQGQTILKDGIALGSPEENIAEMTEQAEAFAKTRIPILKSLQIL